MNWKDYEKKLLKNKRFVEVSNQLEPEYQLARSLIAARLQKGISQAQVAKKANTDQASISRLETATSKPSLSLLRKVADALDARLIIKVEI
jgi:ribosome-binding protein aMBF1 (putative translation factor)